MDINKVNISRKLRQYRESCGLSQKQVAQALSLSRSTYTKYETGETEPNLLTLVRIAAIYRVSPVELLPELDVEKKRLEGVAEKNILDSPICNLTRDERGLIAEYRALSEESQAKAIELLSKLSKKGS